MSTKMNLRLTNGYGMSGWLIALAALYYGCTASEGQPSNEPQPVHYVQVEELHPTTEPLPVTASGILASKVEVNLSFKIGGYVEKIFVDEGQTVHRGDLLARLDPAEIDAQVARAQNAFDKTQRDLERVRNLYRDSVATLEQVQDLETAFELARADLQIAHFNRENAAIHALANGRILTKYVEEGEQVSSGSPVIRFGNSGEAAHALRFGVADRDVIRVQPGDSAHIRFDAWPNRIFRGQVSLVAAAADPQTGTFEVEVVLSDHTQQLRNGFIGKITLYPSRQLPYLRVPMDALVEANRETVSVYVPDESRPRGIGARRIQVRPFYIGDTFFAVEAPELPEDNYVITRGAAYLRPGATINIVNEGF